MEVAIKTWGGGFPVKSTGIKLQVKDTTGDHLGNLYITMPGVIWCNGKTQRKNGKALEWPEFMEMIERLGH